jgi:hypothetical protein
VDNDWYWIVMRFLHIVPGTFWVGASIMMAVFIEPSFAASGPAGGQVMEQLVEKQKFSAAMGLTSWVAVVAGIALYWRTSMHFNEDWITTGVGTLLTVGGVAAIIALLMGTFGNARVGKALTEQGKALQAAAGPPQEPELARMRGLQAQMRLLSRIEAVLLVIAIGTMAIARYVSF